MVLPGSKVVTVPSVDVVVVVVSVVPVTGCVFVVVDSVVVVLVWANAKGAMAAQARTRMLFFILFPSVVDVSLWLGFPLQTANRRLRMTAAPVKVRHSGGRDIQQNFYLAISRKMFRGLSPSPHRLTCPPHGRCPRSRRYSRARRKAWSPGR